MNWKLSPLSLFYLSIVIGYKSNYEWMFFPSFHDLITFFTKCKRLYMYLFRSVDWTYRCDGDKSCHRTFSHLQNRLCAWIIQNMTTRTRLSLSWQTSPRSIFACRQDNQTVVASSQICFRDGSILVFLVCEIERSVPLRVWTKRNKVLCNKLSLGINVQLSTEEP